MGHVMHCHGPRGRTPRARPPRRTVDESPVEPRRPEGGQLHEQGGTMGSATGAIAWALLLLSPGRGHAEDSDNLADHHAAASASRTAESDEPAAWSRPSVSMQCTAGTEKSGSGTTANWPTYHFMNNVTKNASGALLLEPLNDANAIAEYKGALLQHDGGLPLLPPREG